MNTLKIRVGESFYMEQIGAEVETFRDDHGENPTIDKDTDDWFINKMEFVNCWENAEPTKSKKFYNITLTEKAVEFCLNGTGALLNSLDKWNNNLSGEYDWDKEFIGLIKTAERLLGICKEWKNKI